MARSTESHQGRHAYSLNDDTGAHCGERTTRTQEPEPHWPVSSQSRRPKQRCCPTATDVRSARYLMSSRSETADTGLAVASSINSRIDPRKRAKCVGDRRQQSREWRTSNCLAQPVHNTRRARAHQRVEQRQHTCERLCLGQSGKLGYQQTRRYERQLSDRKSEAGLRVRTPVHADFGPRAISLIRGKRGVNSQRTVREQAATVASVARPSSPSGNRQLEERR
jgi:hypothetical protein